MKTYKHCKYQDKEECTIEGKCEVTGYRLNQTYITILQVNSYFQKLLKTTNLRTIHRGNSLTEPSVNGLGETMGKLSEID